MLMNKKYISLALAFLLLASCSLSSSMDETVNRDIEKTVELREQAKAPSKEAIEDTVRVKNDIWLGDKSNVEYEGEPLPAHLQTTDAITLVSSRPVTLYEIGDMINKVTSLSIRYAAELEESTVTDGGDNKPSVDAMGADWTEPNKMILSYKGSLDGLLDEVGSRFGLWWKYEDNSIHFYRQITKTFVIYSLPSKTSVSASVGGTTDGDGATSNISLTSTAEIELWGNIEKSITSMVGESASVATDPSNGTITVTARPTEIAKIAKFVNEQNARLSRQVAVSVKVLQVTVEEGDDYGLDLNAAFSGGSIESLGVNNASSSGITDTASNLAMSIASGNWDISTAINALSTQGKTSLVTSGTVTTLNNKPAPIQVVQKETYISEITITRSGSDTDESADITTETEEVETGFTLDVLPRILEHNRLLLLFNLTLSELLELEKVNLNGVNGEDGFIQNPKVESRGFSQEIALRSGESLVLTGFEKAESNVTKSGVGSTDVSLLGGYVKTAKERNILVIILTPVVLDSPLSPESRMNLR